MTTEATLTSKGQTTIPKEIRDSLHMKAGDRMTFTLMPDATVVMRWEAATYRSQNGLAASRELLYDQAELVTGTILGSLRDIRRVTFTMVRGGQVLATGDIARFQGLMLRFAPQLGGGIYTKPASRQKVYRPGGGEMGSLL